MKKLSAVLSLMALTLGLCNAVFAATEYVITNDNAVPNTASVYRLDTITGVLTQFAVLQTGLFPDRHSRLSGGNRLIYYLTYMLGKKSSQQHTS